MIYLHSFRLFALVPVINQYLSTIKYKGLWPCYTVDLSTYVPSFVVFCFALVKLLYHGGSI